MRIVRFTGELIVSLLTRGIYPSIRIVDGIERDCKLVGAYTEKPALAESLGPDLILYFADGEKSINDKPILIERINIGKAEHLAGALHSILQTAPECGEMMHRIARTALKYDSED